MLCNRAQCALLLTGARVALTTTAALAAVCSGRDGDGESDSFDDEAEEAAVGLGAALLATHLLPLSPFTAEGARVPSSVAEATAAALLPAKAVARASAFLTPAPATAAGTAFTRSDSAKTSSSVGLEETVSVPLPPQRTPLLLALAPLVAALSDCEQRCRSDRGQSVAATDPVAAVLAGVVDASVSFLLPTNTARVNVHSFAPTKSHLQPQSQSFIHRVAMHSALASASILASSIAQSSVPAPPLTPLALLAPRALSASPLKPALLALIEAAAALAAAAAARAAASLVWPLLVPAVAAVDSAVRGHSSRVVSVPAGAVAAAAAADEARTAAVHALAGDLFGLALRGDLVPVSAYEAAVTGRAERLGAAQENDWGHLNTSTPHQTTASASLRGARGVTLWHDYTAAHDADNDFHKQQHQSPLGGAGLWDGDGDVDHEQQADDEDNDNWYACHSDCDRDDSCGHPCGTCSDSDSDERPAAANDNGSDSDLDDSELLEEAALSAAVPAAETLPWAAPLRATLTEALFAKLSYLTVREHTLAARSQPHSKSQSRRSRRDHAARRALATLAVLTGLSGALATAVARASAEAIATADSVAAVTRWVDKVVACVDRSAHSSSPDATAAASLAAAATATETVQLLLRPCSVVPGATATTVLTLTPARGSAAASIVDSAFVARHAEALLLRRPPPLAGSALWLAAAHGSSTAVALLVCALRHALLQKPRQQLRAPAAVTHAETDDKAWTLLLVRTREELKRSLCVAQVCLAAASATENVTPAAAATDVADVEAICDGARRRNRRVRERETVVSLLATALSWM